jgi:hypothetical protein
MFDLGLLAVLFSVNGWRAGGRRCLLTVFGRARLQPCRKEFELLKVSSRPWELVFR